MQAMPVKEKTVGESVIYSLPVPMPIPVPMEPAITVIDNDLLLVASHPSVIEKALVSKKSGGGMLQSASFKNDFTQMPGKINSAFYTSKLFSQTAIDVQKSILDTVGEEALQGVEANMVLSMVRKMTARKDNYLAMYSVVDDSGIFSHCNMYTSGMNPIAEFITGQLSALPMAFPLMKASEQGNRSKAMSSEALAGCGTVATCLRLTLAENNGSFGKSYDGAATIMEYISPEDLNGTYFDTVDYVISETEAGKSTYTITCTGTSTSGRGENEGKTAGIIVTLDQDGNNSFTINE